MRIYKSTSLTRAVRFTPAIACLRSLMGLHEEMPRRGPINARRSRPVKAYAGLSREAGADHANGESDHPVPHPDDVVAGCSAKFRACPSTGQP